MTPKEPDRVAPRRIVRTETSLGRLLLIEATVPGSGWPSPHRVELAETRQVLECTTAARVYEEVTVRTARTWRDQTVAAVLRREQADVEVTGPAGDPQATPEPQPGGLRRP